MVETISSKRPKSNEVNFKDFPKVIAKRIKNNYFGLFAKREISKGEILFFVRGEKIHDIDNDYAPDYPDALRISQNTWINPNQYNPLTYTNHSCNPNASIIGNVTFRALVDINKDQEITFDYGLSEIDTEWFMGEKCLCGEKNCRKIITSVQSIPKKKLESYLPFIPTWIRKFLKI